MAFQKIEDLPQDIKEKMPQGAQQVFMTAVNSAQSDGLSEERAMQVGWDTIKNNYEQGNDGKWQHKPEGGSDNSPLGSMGGA